MDQSYEKCDILLITLRKIIRAIDLHSRQLVQKHGVTGPQMLLLKVICQTADQPINSSQLASTVSLSQATVTSILDRLVEKGYIQRAKSQEDKRKVFIYATEGAKTIVQQYPTLLQEEFVKQFDALHDWEQSLMLSSLERIAEMMYAKNIDAAPMLANTELDYQQKV